MSGSLDMAAEEKSRGSTESRPTGGGGAGRARAFGEGELGALYEALGVAGHPILKLPTLAQVRGLLAQPGGREQLVEHLRLRNDRIALAATDPLHWSFEPEPWRDADEWLKVWKILAIFGGNRATKSYYAWNRAVRTAVAYPRAVVALVAEKEEASIAGCEKVVWAFLKPLFGHLNNKRGDDLGGLSYNQKTGFAGRKIVLPNRSEIYFLTYKQEAGDYEGWEFGAPPDTFEQVGAELKAQGKFVPPNIGAVADESLTLSWLQMLSRRVPYRKAKLLWSFTPVKGITPAVKELVGAGARTLASRPSELLPRRNLPDLPEGHMPYIRECTFKGAGAIYFHTIFNPLGPSAKTTYYEEIRQQCQGKSSELVERVAYGYARDSAGRAFKKFGAWNIVKRKDLPAIGTNYFFTDPAGTRSWMTCWVRVTPGNPGSYYFYRDWPDAVTYGEWAVPTERETNDTTTRGWDGDPGPAQMGVGLGVTGYKKLFLECERVKVPASVAGWVKAGNGQGSTESRPTGEGRPTVAELDGILGREELDPYQARLIRAACLKGRPLDKIYEEIAERFVDPRAGRNEHIAEQGGTCIIEEFAEEQKDAKTGEVTGPAMDLTPASGVNIDEGITQLHDLLEWNQEEKLTPIVNQPHLFVCEDCEQMRWMFENYTGRGGEKGACKDPADLARYAALEKLEHVADLQARAKAGGGF